MGSDESRRSLPAVPLEPLLERDPRELGPFRLLGRLGSGGMGVAYLADGLGQWAVVKVVRSELADDPAFRARLTRELAAIDRLEGQTARVLQSSLDGPTPWFAMEFLAGRTLDHRVRDRGPISGTELVDLARALAEVVSGVHAAGIVHRDIKPSNVMISPDGVRLIDFGIAEMEDGTQLTRTGSVMGSMGWLAPEQVRGDATGPATDVHAWALCVVFAATGQAPFGNDTSVASMYRVLESAPEVPTSITEPLNGLLARALTKDPSSRPTLDEVIGLNEALARDTSPPTSLDPDATTRQVMTTKPSPAKARSRPPSQTSALSLAHPNANPARTPPRGRAAVTVVLLAALAGLGWVIWNWTNQEHTNAVAQDPPSAAAESSTGGSTSSDSPTQRAVGRTGSEGPLSWSAIDCSPAKAPDANGNGGSWATFSMAWENSGTTKRTVEVEVAEPMGRKRSWIVDVRPGTSGEEFGIPSDGFAFACDQLDFLSVTLL